jgi:hypothetical protein
MEPFAQGVEVSRRTVVKCVGLFSRPRRHNQLLLPGCPHLPPSHARLGRRLAHTLTPQLGTYPSTATATATAPLLATGPEALPAAGDDTTPATPHITSDTQTQSTVRAHGPLTAQTLTAHRHNPHIHTHTTRARDTRDRHMYFNIRPYPHPHTFKHAITHQMPLTTALPKASLPTPRSHIHTTTQTTPATPPHTLPLLPHFPSPHVNPTPHPYPLQGA